MENSGVKYVPYPTDAKKRGNSPIKMLPQTMTEKVDFKKTTKGQCPVFVSFLALVLALGVFTLVFTWLWGVPETSLNNETKLAELQRQVEEQARKIAELEREVAPPTGNCQSPMKKGDCFGSIQRWYMNSQTGRCQQFSYTGCGGNWNNFVTLAECQKACQMADKSGPETATKEAEKGEPPADCTVDPEMGPCKARIERFYFDNRDKVCRKFSYGGCEGNSNNFKTLNDCLASCSNDNSNENLKGSSEAADDLCSLPNDIGPCRSAIARWFFDQVSGSCQEFSWGGCKGNENNFVSEAKCLQRCGNKGRSKAAPSPTKARPSLCSLPYEIGMCRAAFARFYFDPQTGKCESFTFGGCDGNENNFETKELCQQTCMV